MPIPIAKSMKASGTNSGQGRSGNSSAGASGQSRVEQSNVLISRARGGSRSSLGTLLEQYRNYLAVLATTQIEKRLQPRVSPSDIVQETMLRAHKNFGQFRGTTEQELLAWLRQILVNNLARFVEQHMMAARRDVRREVSIERLGVALEQSTIQLAALVPSQGKSPSMAVQQREEAVVLADRLAQLPDDYREVLVLRNLQGLPFDDVAQRIGRSVGATRMLWLRAIEKLRTVYRKEEPSEV
ncbi:MAG TPA: sigma-70 family RNA polymerase sigma factor [Lacipirellulaceae bacterium]|nr:sigma-70 family RNA polymerase sigma factor [Lacipirellulaceae bacterium]